jgi:hypothetical protein
VYGPLTDLQGRTQRVADLRTDEVLLSRAAPQGGAIHAGQRVQVTWYDIPMTVTVRAVLANDPVVTTGELAQDAAVAGVIAPLAAIQLAFAHRYHHTLTLNTICVKNVGPGGIADVGPGGSRSRTGGTPGLLAAAGVHLSAPRRGSAAADATMPAAGCRAAG